MICGDLKPPTAIASGGQVKASAQGDIMNYIFKKIVVDITLLDGLPAQQVIIYIKCGYLILVIQCIHHPLWARESITSYEHICNRLMPRIYC